MPRANRGQRSARAASPNARTEGNASPESQARTRKPRTMPRQNRDAGREPRQTAPPAPQCRARTEGNASPESQARTRKPRTMPRQNRNAGREPRVTAPPAPQCRARTEGNASPESQARTRKPRTTLRQSRNAARKSRAKHCARNAMAERVNRVQTAPPEPQCRARTEGNALPEPQGRAQTEGKSPARVASPTDSALSKS